MNQRSVSSALLATIIALVPMAMIIFATGYFPYKPFLPGLAEYHDLPRKQPPSPPFEKVIFMVVDALRSDFVYTSTSGFEYTQSLIRDGSAMPFTAHAQAPTVTMPRLKALTTGSIPSFLDMILNIAESDTSSSLAAQDTWLAQMKRKCEGKMIMYGDDTWLKLFPNTFDRADGTTSFFVSDFTEVDNNVTRHVPEQLASTDWSVMILHYLGLDHIGHKSGPESVNMLPKQKEMDLVVAEIYDAMQKQPHHSSTLLVLCGDHGMNDAGNHGGSSPGETSPALLFVSPLLRTVSSGSKSPSRPSPDYQYYDKVEQSDVVPSLAGLLGFPVPLNNLGVFIPPLLKLWPQESDQLQLLQRNALQLLDMVKAAFPHSSYGNSAVALQCSGAIDAATQLACLWRAATEIESSNVGDNDLRSAEALRHALLAFCRKAQSDLSSTASNYDAKRLYAGIGFCIIAVGLSLWLIVPGMTFRGLSADAAILGLAVAYIAMMFASSYVEEEQQFWYWATTAWVMAPCGVWSKSRAQSSLLTAVILRILRRWSQSGQKYAGSPDIASSFLAKSPLVLAALVAATYFYIAYQLQNSTFPHLGAAKTTSRVLALSLSAVALLFKTLFTLETSPRVFQILAKVVFSSSAIICLLALVRKPSRGYHGRRVNLNGALQPALLLVVVTQSSATIIPEWGILGLLFRCFNDEQHDSTLPAAAVRRILISQFAYFAGGGTNSISSLKLAHAYNGLDTYRPALCGLLGYLSNFGASSLDGDERVARSTLQDDDRDSAGAAVRWERWEAWKRKSAYQAFFMASMVLGVMAACCLLRTHLFVWTVFSPKFLYAAVWFVGWFVCGEVAIGGSIVFLDSMFE